MRSTTVGNILNVHAYLPPSPSPPQNPQKSRPAHHLMDRIHDLLCNFQVAQARIRNIDTPGYRMGLGRAKLDDGSTGWKDWALLTQTKLKFIWTPGHPINLLVKLSLSIEGNQALVYNGSHVHVLCLFVLSSLHWINFNLMSAGTLLADGNQLPGRMF